MMLTTGKTWLIGSALAGAFAITTATPMPSASAYAFERERADRHNWATGNNFCVSNGDPMGWDALGCFAPDGDKIQPADLKKDGRRVAVHWRTGYGRRGLCVNAGGKDSNTQPLGLYLANGDYECRINVREHTWIKIRVGSCNGSKVNCGVMKKWGHWSDWKTVKTSG